MLLIALLDLSSRCQLWPGVREGQGDGVESNTRLHPEAKQTSCKELTFAYCSGPKIQSLVSLKDSLPFGITISTVYSNYFLTLEVCEIQKLSYRKTT